MNNKQVLAITTEQRLQTVIPVERPSTPHAPGLPAAPPPVCTTGPVETERPRPRPVGGRPPISAIVTSKNEEHSIIPCLESLLWCDEILLVDSYSSDQTVDLARSFDKVRVLQRPYYGGASQKNWAIDRARHDWIIILDADERVTPELRLEIELLLSSGSLADAYRIGRRTFFLGREICYSGWQNDGVVRLFRRGAARYPNRRVHADMQTREPADSLNARIVHHMVDDFREYTERIQRYAYWGASQLWLERRRAGAYEVLLRTGWRFLRTYLLQAGFRDGMSGLVFCLVQSYGTFLKWATLWSWQTDLRRGKKPDLPAFDENEQTWAWPEAVV